MNCTEPVIVLSADGVTASAPGEGTPAAFVSWADLDRHRATFLETPSAPDEPAQVNAHPELERLMGQARAIPNTATVDLLCAEVRRVLAGYSRNVSRPR